MRYNDKQMVAFRINPRLINRFDKIVKDQGRTRQDTIVALIQNYLTSRHRRPPTKTPSHPLFDNQNAGDH